MWKTAIIAHSRVHVCQIHSAAPFSTYFTFIEFFRPLNSFWNLLLKKANQQDHILLLYKEDSTGQENLQYDESNKDQTQEQLFGEKPIDSYGPGKTTSIF